MLQPVIVALDIALALLRPAVFVAGAFTAVMALVSWGVRTRRISPFSGVARLTRERVDPWLIAPMERRVVRAGGMPHAAPWWALALVVVGGLLLLYVVQFLRDQLLMLNYASSMGGRGLLQVLIAWTFGFLRIALFARVISSWVGGSPYSKWWRWSYVVTEPILAPLRRVIPTIGMFDVSVIVAYFGLGLLQSVLMSLL